MIKTGILVFGAVAEAGIVAAADVHLKPGFDPVEIPYAATPAAFTFATEFRTLKTSEYIAIPGFLAYVGNAIPNGFALRLQSEGNKYVMQMCMGDSRKQGGAAWVTGPNPKIDPGRWCRVLARWDGKKITLDVDGVRVGEEAYDGKFVPAANGLFSANRDGQGYTYYPLEMTMADLEERAWSEDEAASFFAARRKDDAQSVALAESLRRYERGAAVTVAELERNSRGVALHPISRNLLEEALAFALLREGQVARACASADSRLKSVPFFSEPDRARDFVPRFAAALMRAGEKMLAVKYFENDYHRLRDDMRAARPYAAIALEEAYAAVGRHEEAKRMAQDAAFFAKGTRLEEILQPGGPACVLPDRPAEVKEVRDPSARLFVSTDGDDANPGTFDKPFKTLVQARDAMRAILAKQAPPGGAAVYLRGGRYMVRGKLEFGPADSGSPAAPVLWSAWKDERPVLDGTAAPAGFAAVNDPAALARIPATNTFIVARGWRDFRIEGISFEGGRDCGAWITSATNGVISGCSFRGFGVSGLGVSEGRNVTVEKSSFRDFGRAAIQIGGGDRKTLTPCYHRALDCEIAWNGLFCRVHPAVLINGVGVEFTRNRIHDAPSSVLRVEGNDHLIVSNDVRRAVQECDDNGAVDMYRDPTYAGCKYLYNYWEDCGSTNGFADCGQAAIRFDGNISGMTVYGNRFKRCGTVMFGAINVNGGRLNVIDSNVFEDCANGITVFFYPDWHWRNIFEGTDGNAKFVRRQSFEAMRIREPPYAVRYPGLASLPELPQINFISRNRAVRGVFESGVPAPTVLYANGG